MQVNSLCMGNYSPNFNGVARFRTKEGATAVLDVIENKVGDICKISGKVWKKGKVIEQIDYHNPKGFSMNRLDQISKVLGKKSKYPQEEADMIILDKLLKASKEKGDRFIGNF